MESFSKVDIFDTQGIEYLFALGYLLLLIAFWQLSGKHKGIITQIKDAVSNLSASILRIPQGIFYNKFHTWTHLEESGEAKVGMDDFLQHLTGEISLSQIKSPGEKIVKGETMTQIDKNGKQLSVLSPISGVIISSNPNLYENPGIINEDPYKMGWIYKIKPTNWKAETHSYFMAEEATSWARSELDRFKDFLTRGPMQKYSADPSMVLLQDGGEIKDNLLGDLPEEVWHDFQKEFLSV